MPANRYHIHAVTILKRDLTSKLSGKIGVTLRVLLLKLTVQFHVAKVVMKTDLNLWLTQTHGPPNERTSTHAKKTNFSANEPGYAFDDKAKSEMCFCLPSRRTTVVKLSGRVGEKLNLCRSFKVPGPNVVCDLFLFRFPCIFQLQDGL